MATLLAFGIGYLIFFGIAIVIEGIARFLGIVPPSYYTGTGY